MTLKVMQSLWAVDAIFPFCFEIMESVNNCWLKQKIYQNKLSNYFHEKKRKKKKGEN